MRTKIIIGETYGMLTVDAATEEKDSRSRTLYCCTCECTGTRLVAAERLLAGRVTSCGCMRQKNLKRTGGSKERAGWTPEQEAGRNSKRVCIRSNHITPLGSDLTQKCSAHRAAPTLY